MVCLGGRYKRYKISRLLHRAAKKQREAIKEGAQPLYLLEGVNFQDVQLGSQEKLVSSHGSRVTKLSLKNIRQDMESLFEF